MSSSAVLQAVGQSAVTDRKRKKKQQAAKMGREGGDF